MEGDLARRAGSTPWQLGPRHPVDRQLERVGVLGAVGLPVDEQEAPRRAPRTPRRSGRAPPGPPSTSANAGSTAYGVRSANGPASKRRDQRVEVVLVVDARVGAPGQVVGVEHHLLAEPALDPGVEAGAEPGRRRRLRAASAGPARGRTPPGRRAAAPTRWPRGWRAGAPATTSPAPASASSGSRSMAASHSDAFEERAVIERFVAVVLAGDRRRHQLRRRGPAVDLGRLVRDRPRPLVAGRRSRGWCSPLAGLSNHCRASAPHPCIASRVRPR